MEYRYIHKLRLLAFLILSIALAACGEPTSSGGERPASAPSGGVQTGSGGPTVQVTAKEFSLTLDPAQAKAGSITFVVKNDGHAPHNFQIQGNGVEQATAMLNSGETAQLTVDLPPGIYTYRCAVGGHDQLGMKGTLTVAP